MLFEPWQIKMLGGLQAISGEQTITRFQTQKTACLLAYLALFPDRIHHREELATILWPECDPNAARHRLNQATSTLRNQLEGPERGKGSVIVADRFTIRLNPAGFETDVAEFDRYISLTGQAETSEAKIRYLCRATELHHAQLLNGFYEEWILAERQRLSDAYIEALTQLTSLFADCGAFDQAIACTNKLVALEGLEEQFHLQLMNLYILAGRPAAALKQFSKLTKMLAGELGEKPSKQAFELAKRARSRLQLEPILPSDGRQSLENKLNINEDPKNKPARQHADGHKLPIQFTRFFGRNKELNLLKKLLVADHNRLVTIIGPGGCGKTRLAIEVSRQLATEQTLHAFFIPLADVTDASLITKSIAETLGCNAERLDQQIETMRLHFDKQPSLLILDNFEQLAEAGAIEVRRLLEALPTIKCLVTSRNQLLLEGEQEFRISPLPVPSSSKEDSPDLAKDLSRYPSIQLFVERAQRIKPEFQITRRNAKHISEICRKLEGLPLAIELVAANCETVPPAKMCSQLSESSELLTSKRRDIPSRHSSLEASLDYSCMPLSEELRNLLYEISIFSGGWTAEAATEICSYPKVKEGLAQLISRSLIYPEHTEDNVRYRMLETVRDIAQTRIPSKHLPKLRQKHANYYFKYAKHLYQHGGDTAARYMHQELYNYSNALSYFLESKKPAEGLELTQALIPLWTVYARFKEGKQWLHEFIAIADDKVPKKLLAHSLSGYCSLATQLGDLKEGLVYGEKALKIYHQMKDDKLLAIGLNDLAIPYIYNHSPEKAKRYLIHALRLLGDDENALKGNMLNNLGNVYCLINDLESAKKTFQEALEIAKANQEHRTVASILSNLGSIARYEMNYAAAATYLDESLSVFRTHKSTINYSLTLARRAALALQQNDLALAAKLLKKSLKIGLERNEHISTHYCFLVTGILCCQISEFNTGAKLLGTYQKSHDLDEHEKLLNNFDLHELRLQLSESLTSEEIEVLSSTGTLLSWQESVQLSLSICDQTLQKFDVFRVS